MRMIYNSNMAEKIFVDGMIFKKPRAGAPEFVKGSISIKVADFSKFMREHAKGKEWVNLDLKKSAKGNLYLELNTWQKDDTGKETINTEDVPF